MLILSTGYKAYAANMHNAVVDSRFIAKIPIGEKLVNGNFKYKYDDHEQIIGICIKYKGKDIFPRNLDKLVVKNFCKLEESVIEPTMPSAKSITMRSLFRI